MFVACAGLLLWPSTVLGQAPPAPTNTKVMTGGSFGLLWDYTDVVDGFRVQVTPLDGSVATVLSTVPGNAMLNGQVAVLDLPTPTPGSWNLTVVAFKGAQVSPPSNVVRLFVPTPVVPPAPTSCAYVNPQGVLTPKPIGNDDVRGWNPIDTQDLASVRAFYTRFKQLRKEFGLDAVILASDDGVNVARRADGTPVHPITGKPWSFLYAPCVGVGQLPD